MGRLSALAVTAFCVGISCGTCCSPFVGAFLSTYILSHEKGVQKSTGTFLGFFLGKLLGILGLCITASGIGRQFVDERGFVGVFPFRLAVQALMSLFGIYMAVRWLWEIRGKDAACGHCAERRTKGRQKRMMFPIVVAGILYGVTPCPPLILILGYCAGLTILESSVTAVCFGMAGILSPLIMLMLILGILSNKIRVEIPGFLKWFRLASYVLLIVLPFTLGRV